MKFSRITIKSVRGTSFRFYMDDPTETEPYVVKDVEGLGPPDPGIIVGESVVEGSDFLGTKAKSRRIVMLIGFQPNYAAGQTAGDLREALYELMDSRQSLPLEFQINSVNGTVLAKTPCYVEKFEPDIFSKDPQVQITFSCTSPYFDAPAKVSLSGALGSGLSVPNPGSAPSGFYAEIRHNASSSTSFRLYRDGYGTKSMYALGMSGSTAIFAEDIVRINTIPGEMKLEILRGGTTYNLIPYISSGAEWIQLYPGDNGMRLLTPANWQINKLEFTPRYLGV